MHDFTTVSEWLKKRRITAYPVSISEAIIDSTIWHISYEYFNVFLSNLEIRKAYICPDYIDENDYLITEEMLETAGISKEENGQLLERIAAYNEQVLEEAGAFPKRVYVVCIEDNQRFGYIFENELLVGGKPLIYPEDKLAELIEEDFEPYYM